ERPFDRVGRRLLLARPELRVEKRIEGPGSFRARTLRLGMNMESNRNAADRVPIQPPGELATDARVECLARVGRIRRADPGQYHADDRSPPEPPQDIRFTRGGSPRPDGRLPDRR